MYCSSAQILVTRSYRGLNFVWWLLIFKWDIPHCVKMLKLLYEYVKVKWSCHRPGVAQRVGRGIALLFHDRALEEGKWSAARPGHTLPPEKTRYPLYRRLGGPKGQSRPHRDSIPDRPARSSVAIPTELPGPHTHTHTHTYIYIYI